MRRPALPCAKGRHHTAATQICGRQESGTHANFTAVRADANAIPHRAAERAALVRCSSRSCRRHRRRRASRRCCTHPGACPGRPAEARIRISASPRRATRCVLPIHAQRGIFARRVAHSARAIGPGSSSQWTDSGMCASPATGTPQRMKASVIPAVLAACGHCLTCTAPMQLGAFSVPCACDANAGS
jgi:hypothetical protein